MQETELTTILGNGKDVELKKIHHKQMMIPPKYSIEKTTQVKEQTSNIQNIASTLKAYMWAKVEVLK